MARRRTVRAVELTVDQRRALRGVTTLVVWDDGVAHLRADCTGSWDGQLASEILNELTRRRVGDRSVLCGECAMPLVVADELLSSAGDDPEMVFVAVPRVATAAVRDCVGALLGPFGWDTAAGVGFCVTPYGVVDALTFLSDGLVTQAVPGRPAGPPTGWPALTASATVLVSAIARELVGSGEVAAGVRALDEILAYDLEGFLGDVAAVAGPWPPDDLAGLELVGQLFGAWLVHVDTVGVSTGELAELLVDTAKRVARSRPPAGVVAAAAALAPTGSASPVSMLDMAHAVSA